jgi:DNA-binding LacI/PurR family transcriptional regulator
VAAKPRKRRAVLSTYIYDSLRQAIVRGRYAVGSNIPSEMALCKEFKASRMTVRSALKRLASEGLVQSLPGRGWQVVSGNPRGRPVDTRPVLLSGNGSAEGNECLEVARKALQKQGVDSRIHVNDSAGSPLGEIDWNQIGGAIFYSGIPLADDVVGEAARAGVPLVCAMLAKQESYDTVAPDHFHGAVEGMERVVDLGRRRIAYLSAEYFDNCPDPSFSERRRAYESVVSGLGGEPMVFSSKYGDAFNVPEGRRLADWIRGKGRSRPPAEALFCTIDSLLELALLQFHINGISAKDVVVFGASQAVPRSLLDLHGLKKLLAVRHPIALVGRIAAERILQRLHGDGTPARCTLVKAEVVETRGVERSFDIHERHAYDG